MFEIGPAFFLLSWALMFVFAPLFVLIATRLATRIVLDEIAKDRAGRGGGH